MLKAVQQNSRRRIPLTIPEVAAALYRNNITTRKATIIVNALAKCQQSLHPVVDLMTSPSSIHKACQVHRHKLGDKIRKVFHPCIPLTVRAPKAGFRFRVLAPYIEPDGRHERYVASYVETDGYVSSQCAICSFKMWLFRKSFPLDPATTSRQQKQPKMSSQLLRLCFIIVRVYISNSYSCDSNTHAPLNDL